LGGALATASSKVQSFFFEPADPRAYAALRIGYAVATLAILIDLWPIRINLFAETGMVGGGGDLSLTGGLNAFIWLHSELAVTLYMAFSGVCLALLGLGIAPRVMAICAYIWAVSYNATAYYAAGGYDELARLIGFAIMISPTVSIWSVGKGWMAGRSWPEGQGPPKYGLRIIQWQLFLVYFATVWMKVANRNWRDGDIIAYFWMSIFSRFPHPIYADHLWLSALVAWSTLAIELAIPILLWVPRTRMLALLLGVLLHGVIGVTSKLALFGLMIVPLYVAFFEKADFDKLERWTKRLLARRSETRERVATS
jgi:hypothetical protein